MKNFSKMRESLNRQYDDEKAHKNDYSNNSGANMMLFDEKMLGGMKQLKFKKDSSYLIRFVPYQVDATHPLVKQGRLEEDGYSYVMNFDMHVVGQDNMQVICPKGTYEEKCPICERSFSDKSDGNEDSYKALKSRRRVLYNVVVLKEGDSISKNMNEVFLLHESQYLFAKDLQDELDKGGDEDEDSGSPVKYNMYSFCVGAEDDKRNAKALRVTCTGENLTKKFSFKVVPYKSYWDKMNEDEVLEKALPLHKLLRHPGYDELDNMLMGIDSSPKDDDDDDDEEEREVYSKSPSSARHDNDRKPSRKDDDDDEDDDEDPVDDEPPFETDVLPTDAGDAVAKESKATSPAEGSCPAGYRFGKDCNMYDECAECDMYDDCLAARKSMKK